MSTLFSAERITYGPPALEELNRARQKFDRHMYLTLTILVALAAGDAIAAILDHETLGWFVLDIIVMGCVYFGYRALTCPYDRVTGEAECAQLYELCAQSTEGQAYRAAVLAQKREFVRGEQWMLQEWAQSNVHGSAYNQLYGRRKQASQD